MSAHLEELYDEKRDRQEKRRKVLVEKAVLPFDDAMIRRVYLIPDNATLPIEPVRLRNVTKKIFEYYTSRGIPVIVEDGFDTWKAKGVWSCDWFQKEYPDDMVEGWTYGDEAAQTGKKKKKFRMPFKELDVMGDERRITQDKITDPLNPTVMSWLWFPFEPNRDENSPSSLSIKKYYDVPYFIPKTKVNRITVRNRFEAFFGKKDSGVQPHADDICQFIFSAQAAGQKRWRLTVPLGTNDLQRLNPDLDVQKEDYRDLQDRMLKEHPLYQFTLKAGDQVFFPPGMIHGTKVMSDECSMSLSLQFSDPSPVKYVSAWADQLQTLSGCWTDYWNYWTFGVAGLESDGSKEQNKEECLQLFVQFDISKDGFISKREIATALKTNPTYMDALNDGDQFKDVRNDADSFIRLHDANGDNRVDAEEYMTNCQTWSVSRATARAHAQATNSFVEEMLSAWRELGPTPNHQEVTQEMFASHFPKNADLWPVVTKALDSDDNGIVELQELEEFLEEIEDVQYPKHLLAPVALLLTGDETGLDELLHGTGTAAESAMHDEL